MVRPVVVILGVRIVARCVAVTVIPRRCFVSLGLRIGWCVVATLDRIVTAVVVVVRI